MKKNKILFLLSVFIFCILKQNVECQCASGSGLDASGACVTCTSLSKVYENGLCVSVCSEGNGPDPSDICTPCSVPLGGVLYQDGECVASCSTGYENDNGICRITTTTTTVTSTTTTETSTESSTTTSSSSTAASYTNNELLTDAYTNLTLYNPQYNPDGAIYLATQADYTNSLVKCSNYKYKKCNPLYWFRKPDGSCNNLKFGWWGKSFSPYKRIAKPAYADLVSAPRKFSIFGQALKSPRLIASVVHSSKDVQKRITHFLPIFGQYLMHDMIRTGHTYEDESKYSKSKKSYQKSPVKGCPCSSASSSCINIEIPKHDTILPVSQRDSGYVNSSCLIQVRERDSQTDFKCDLGHREQINEATAWLDQSNTYGNNVKQEKSLRQYNNGRLKANKINKRDSVLDEFMPSKCNAKNDFKLLIKENVCFKSGDDRVNENPLLAGVHTVFLREHNRVVGGLLTTNPSWDDERLFQEGRRIMNAIYQNIIYAEWLPLVLGEYFHKSFGLNPLDTYRQPSLTDEYSFDGYFNRYNPYIVPNVAIEFAAGAGRFGHALVRSLFNMVTENFQPVGNYSLSDSLFRPKLLLKNGEESFNRMMRGCLSDLGNNHQPHITRDLLDYLVVDQGNLNPTHYHSLPALNINRGRDVGLQGYNKYRIFAGLNVAKSFEELTWIHPRRREKLKKVYASVDDIDLFSGAMSEQKVPGGLVGPTFAYILARGFRDWKYGDRFYFENSPQVSPYAFTPSQLYTIRSIKMSSILCNTMDLDTVPSNAFLKPDTITNPYVTCKSLPQLNLSLFKDLTQPKPEYVKKLSSKKTSKKTSSKRVKA